MEGRAEKVSKETASTRKHKKRSTKKAQRLDSWCSDASEQNSGVPLPNMDYSPMFWQQAVPAQMPHNGQRLFTAMSDPSVCGYSTVPVAYAMEPVSMPPIYPLYRPLPQPNYRAVRGRPRRNVSLNPVPLPAANGYSSLQENRSNYTSALYQNGDYTSLPPSANNHSVHEEELNSEQRRYSDPGLGPADMPQYENSADSDSGDSGSSITTIDKNNKLVLSLVEQMTNLREANSQMFKELHETKLSLESVKAELLQVKQSTDYQPGMMSDIIGEMRQANRILDETTMAKVHAIVEERSQQRIAELAEIKDRLEKMTEEKSTADERVAKLEEELASLKISLNSNERREIAAFEEETLALRRELQEARASKMAMENHTAKCVEAIERPITPVTFETPCITSTPVRTDIPESRRSSCDQVPNPLQSLSPSNSSRKAKSAVEIDDWHWNSDSPWTSESDSPRITRKGSSETIKSMEPEEREALERLINFHFSREHRIAQGTDAQPRKLLFTNAATSSNSSEPGDKHPRKSKRKHGVVEVPDVVVVAGKSVVPKDLCSTRILTSRVLTAPSCATYTTAYI